MADKMAVKSEISDYFKTDKEKGDITQLWVFFHTHASIYKQTLLFTTFGNDRKWEFKMVVV